MEGLWLVDCIDLDFCEIAVGWSPWVMETSWMCRMGRALGQSSIKNNLRFLLGKEVCEHSFGPSTPCQNRNTALSMAVSSRRAPTLPPVVGGTLPDCSGYPFAPLCCSDECVLGRRTSLEEHAAQSTDLCRVARPAVGARWGRGGAGTGAVASAEADLVLLGFVTKEFSSCSAVDYSVFLGNSKINT